MVLESLGVDMVGEVRGGVRISKRVVDAAKPDAELYRLWDSELKGFGLRISPKGVKTYVVMYRAGGGRRAIQKEYTVGRHGPLTPEQARGEAQRLLSAVHLGEDPQAARAEARRELTMAELCDLYMEEGVNTKKASTLYDDGLRIRRHIKPMLGKRPVSSITSADVERLMRDIADGKTKIQRRPNAAAYKAQVTAAKAAGQPRPPKPDLRTRTAPLARGGRGAATRVIGLLGGIFTFAVRRKLIAENPVKGVKRYPDRHCQRFLSSAELARLNTVLLEGERDGLNCHALHIIRLLVFTGARRSEIEHLRWSEVDLEHGYLRLEDSKTGPRRVPLGVPAQDILAGLARTSRSPFVFASEDPAKPYIGTSTVWKMKIRPKADLDGVRLHDLRHTFASLSVGAGLSLPMTGAMLGHRNVRTTAQYAHLADDPIREAADLTARAAAAAMAGPELRVIEGGYSTPEKRFA